MYMLVTRCKYLHVQTTAWMLEVEQRMEQLPREFQIAAGQPIQSFFSFVSSVTSVVDYLYEDYKALNDG